MNGAQLSDFEIGPLLGQGGMAVVHRAVFKPTGETVALKLILPEGATDPTNLERFRREVRATMALDHDNICRVMAAGETNDGRMFMAMEVVDGGSVRELKHKLGGTVPVQVAIEIVGQLLAALDVAHRAGIVHRDLKPANLMLTKSGVLKLVDFGIARSSSDHTLTATGMLVGTPAFMSPEQVRGDPLDGRADLFAAGLILHDLLCGRSPYHSDNPGTSLVKVLQEDVPSFFDVLLGIDPAIEAFHSKLTAKEPADRYRDAATALKALQPSLLEMHLLHPHVLAECLQDPRVARRLLAREQATTELERGRTLVKSHGPVVAAALAFENAVALDATCSDAIAELATVGAALDFHTDVRTDARLLETQEALRANPQHPGLLKRLADQHRAAGNLRESARCLKRYLRLKDDAAALQQLVVVLWGPGSDPALVTGTLQRLRTQDIMAGVKTGGMPAIRPDKATRVDSSVDDERRARVAEAARASMARPATFETGSLAGHDEGAFAALREKLGGWLWLLAIGGVAVVMVVFAATSSRSLVKAAQTDMKRHAEGEVIAQEDQVFNMQATKLNEARAALEKGSFIACSVAATQSFAGESTAKMVLDGKWYLAQCSLLAGDVSAAQDALQDFKDNANIKDKRFEIAKTQLAAIARGEVPGGVKKW